MTSLMPAGRWLAFGVAACAGWTTAACTFYRPPFTEEPSARAVPGPDDATLVFLWPVSSCDPAGYFTLATTGGRFLGNVARGTQLRAVVPAGDLTIVGWDEAMEAVNGEVRSGTVPVLTARVAGGRTYYIRVLLGEWDDHGPPPPGLRSGSIVVNGAYHSTGRRCVETPVGMTSAMVSVPPSSEAWAQLPEWTTRLAILEPDRAAGQAWLDAHRATLAAHRGVGESRLGALRPEARKMATIEVDDGIASAR